MTVFEFQFKTLMLALLINKTPLFLFCLQKDTNEYFDTDPLVLHCIAFQSISHLLKQFISNMSNTFNQNT